MQKFLATGLLQKHMHYMIKSKFYKRGIAYPEAMPEIIYLEDEAEAADLVTELLEAIGLTPRHEFCARRLYDSIMQRSTPCHNYLLDEENISPTNPDRISGSELALKILEMDPDARIVIGTGHKVSDLPLSAQEAIMTGKMGYLQKPFGMDQLAEMYN